MNDYEGYEEEYEEFRKSLISCPVSSLIRSYQASWEA